MKNGQVGTLRSRNSQLSHFASVSSGAIRIVAAANEPWQIQEYDLRGRIVCSIAGKGPKTVSSLRSLSKGSYAVTVRFLNDNTIVRQKIVVQ